jgi:hypothetical protein
MPYQLTNPDSLINLGDAEKFDYKYDYPDRLNLKPGGELHQRLLSRLLRYSWEAAKVQSSRRPAWDEINKTLTAYISLSDKERLIKHKDPRKPVSIVFPYSYAILETLVSYLVAAFFPSPVFRYEGVAPEDVSGAILMEKIIDLQVTRNKVALNLHTFFRDACAYGFGVCSPYWLTRYGRKQTREESGFYDGDGQFTQTGFSRGTSRNILFEGNAISNIDPYNYLPDPNYSIHDVQKGEYVAWLDRTNYMDLLAEEQDDPTLFNVRYLLHSPNRASGILGTDSRTSRTRSLRGDATQFDRSISLPVDQLHIYVKLIPSQWKLGSSDIPEKWLFTVANDSVIVRANPLDLDHDMYPVVVAAPDFDGYSPLAYSRLEILNGMQTVIDWLFNSHIANVRKAINDVLIVDPYLLNIEDLRDPEPGGLVRLRRPAWGRGVENAVKQLAVTDITRSNLQDVAFIVEYMQTMTGTDNAVMGNLRKGGPERLSAREFQGTAQGAVNRLERIAKVIGLQALQDLGYMFAYHTQQFMTQDVYVKTTGDWPDKVQRQFNIQEGRIRVSPLDILVDYDLMVRDGSVPGGNFSDIWTQLFQIIGTNEQLSSQFDVVNIFKYIATSLGAKNVDAFERTQPAAQVQAAPDEQVMNQVANGELVSLLEQG